MSNSRAHVRAVLTFALLALLAAGCRAEFDIERDVAAAGNANLITENATDASTFDTDDRDDITVELEDPDDDGDLFELDLDGSGSFSFEASTDGIAGEGGIIPTGPGTEPERDMSWNSDAQSVLDHLASIAPPESGLSFEWKTVPISDDEAVTGPFPVGWEISEPFLGITLEPGDGYDFFTDASIDAGCQGSCAPQDWGALMDDPEVSPFASEPSETVAVFQELSPVPGESPAGRLLVTLDPESSFSPGSVAVTRWSNEASRFLWCTVSLDEDDVVLWPVMADMCAAMRPDWMS